MSPSDRCARCSIERRNHTDGLCPHGMTRYATFIEQERPMLITIEIDTSNAAFEDDMAGEIRRAIGRATEKAVRLAADLPRTALVASGVPLRDSNGNTIGQVTVTRSE